MTSESQDKQKKKRPREGARIRDPVVHTRIP